VAVIGAMLMVPVVRGQTAGSATLTATINDLGAGSGSRHAAVVWLTKADGTFVTTLWKQGPSSFTNSIWLQHFVTWTAQRGSSTALPAAPDGYTSATATSYAAVSPSPPTSGLASNPIHISWNGLDANGNLMVDGDYKFFIEYAEDAGSHGTDTGGLTTGGLTWTKGAAASTVNPANQGTVGSPSGGFNFTNMSIVWTPAAVALPVIAVEQPVGTALTSGTSTVNFGSSVVGVAVPLTFTIRNTGTASLTGVAVTRDGTNSADFTVTASPAASVAAAGTTTFTVSFNPAASGTRTAALHIASNDATHNPFDISLTGTGTAVALPVIAVEQPVGTALTSGTGTVNFGSSVVGVAVPLTFTIRNTGTASLTGVAVTRDGTNSADFTVTASPAASVAAAGTTTFTVSFNPAASGTRTAALHIASNDATHNPFDIVLTGTGTVAGAKTMIAIEQPVGTVLTSGETRSFPEVALLKSATMAFTVRNTLPVPIHTHAINLRLNKVSISGANAAEFRVIGSYVKKIKPGASTTISVRFTPKTAGPKEALLTILSNAPGQSPYSVRLRGNTPLPDNRDEASASDQANKTAATPRAVTPAAMANVGSGGASPQLMQSVADAGSQFVMARINGQDYPALSFRRLKNPGSLNYVVEESSDLRNWSPVPVPWQVIGPIVDEGDGGERLTVRAFTPMTADSRHFLRLRVEDGQ